MRHFLSANYKMTCHTSHCSLLRKSSLCIQISNQEVFAMRWDLISGSNQLLLRNYDKNLWHSGIIKLSYVCEKHLCLIYMTCILIKYEPITDIHLELIWTQLWLVFGSDLYQEAWKQHWNVRKVVQRGVRWRLLGKYLQRGAPKNLVSQLHASLQRKYLQTLRYLI